MKRIGIAFFYHESHSFTPVKTGINDFKNEAYLAGKDIISHYKGTRTELGAFIDFLEEKSHEIEIIPLLAASAVPSGVVTNDTYKRIEKEILHTIQNSKPLDGILIALHGAMVVEEISDPEAYLLKEIRNITNDTMPIATTLDLHANISEEMFQYATLHYGFKTYPHIDMYEQGLAAANALYNSIMNKKQYYVSFRRLPMLLPSLNMRTEKGPMKKMIEYALEAEQLDGVENVSVFGGFPYADTKSTGASIVVCGTDENIIDEVVEKLSMKYWNLRNQFIVEIPTAEEGLKMALSQTSKKPIALADISDNPLSCGVGDTTKLLEVLLKNKVENTLFGGLYDRDSLEKCKAAEERTLIDLELGGKIAPEFGQPIPVKAEIIKISDGVFYNSGPFNKNLKVDLRGAAHIRVNNIDIVLIGRPMSANDPEMFRHLGIEPTNKSILALKVKNHFRAAFDPLIGEVIYVDTPGVSTNDLSKLTYQNITRPIWPFDQIKSY